MLISLLKLLFECFMLFIAKDKTFYFADSNIDLVWYTSKKFENSSYAMLHTYSSNTSYWGSRSSFGPLSFKQVLRYIEEGKWQPIPYSNHTSNRNPRLAVGQIRLENYVYLFSNKRFAYYLDLDTNKVYTYSPSKDFKYLFLFKGDEKFEDYTLTQEQRLWTAPDRVFLI
jgi:hypothetical protein